MALPTLGPEDDLPTAIGETGGPDGVEWTASVPSYR